MAYDQASVGGPPGPAWPDLSEADREEAKRVAGLILVASGRGKLAPPSCMWWAIKQAALLTAHEVMRDWGNNDPDRFCRNTIPEED